MFDGFFNGSLYQDGLTNKQKLERRIKDNVLDLVLDRNLSFLETARKRDTSIIVQNREGGIRRFNFKGRNYISFPSSLEDDISKLTEAEQYDKMQDLLKLSTANESWKQQDSVSEDEDSGEETTIPLEKEDYIKKLVNKYNDTQGLTPDDFKTIRDEHGVINPEELEVYKFKAKELSKKDKKDLEEELKEEDSKETQLSEVGMKKEAGTGKTPEAKLEAKIQGKDHEYKFEDTDLNIDGNVPEQVEKNRFYNSSSSHISAKREIVLQGMAKQIVKSFKGRIGKEKTVVPSKRLCSKALVSDSFEKIYQNKKSNKGKHLSCNLIIDMSGSMSGVPVKNAVEMVYIFNEIAHMGYLTGSVLWSESSAMTSSTFPMPRKFVKGMVRTGGGEGLGRNMNKFLKQLKEVDTNICMTDGCLTDEPILKELYEKNRIQVLGVYVNNSAEDLSEYTGSLNRWFTRSLVRRTMEELTEKIVAYGLRKKGK